MPPVRILTGVVPRLELVESWEEDELAAVLHEASHDLGVAQKTFMTVLRHALSGMKVRGAIFRNTQNAYSPDRLDLGWQRSWMPSEKNAALLV